jgi:hypothetical protein
MNEKSGHWRTRLWRGGIVLVIIAGLGYATLKTGQLAISDFYSLLAQQEYDRGAGNPGKDGDAQWQRSMGYLSEARRHAPDNAWPMALASDLRTRRMITTTDRRQAFQEAFAVQFDLRAYLKQNPTSSQSWANLALAKYYAGDTGPAMIRDLANAQELGPWQPSTQSTTIAVGLSIWPTLGPADQARLIGTMERAAQRNIDRVAGQAQATNRLDVFCGIAYVRDKKAKVCDSGTPQTRL